MAHVGGDDLDDGLELDETLLASEGEEGFGSDDEAVFSEDEEVVVPSKKRSRSPGSESAAPAVDEDKEQSAKKRRREKDKARRAAKRAAANGDEDVVEATTMSPDAVAEVLLASCRAAMPNGTVMEIDDVKVPADRIVPAFAGEVEEPEDPKEKQFAPLVARLNDVLKDAPKKPKAGTPRALILCLSGIRCADVVRAVRGVKRPGGEVAKLFAKHFKFDDQKKYLNQTRVAVAVGTPARVAKLLADGCLKLTPQSVIFLDIGHRDSKKRSLLTLPEVRDELWKSLLSGDSRAAIRPAKFAAF